MYLILRKQGSMTASHTLILAHLIWRWNLRGTSESCCSRSLSQPKASHPKVSSWFGILFWGLSAITTILALAPKQTGVTRWVCGNIRAYFPSGHHRKKSGKAEGAKQTCHWSQVSLFHVLTLKPALPEAAPFLQLLLFILWQLRCGRMTKVTKVVDKITAGCLAGIS